jgi:predicted small metal-binding protein
MKAIGCRDIGVDCNFDVTGEHEEEVLYGLAQHSIDVHKEWPEDGPVQTWTRVRGLIRETSPSPTEAQGPR